MTKCKLPGLSIIKAFISVGLWIFLSACMPTQLNVSDHSHPYHDGQVALFMDHGDCYLSITGEVNSQLGGLMNQSLSELSAKDCGQRVVLLQSHGGDIKSAMAIGQMIRSHKATTHIHGYCDSACGFVFIGGVQRTVSFGTASEVESELGFHQPKPMDGLRGCLAQSQINPLLLANIKSYLGVMLPRKGAQAYYQELLNSPCRGMDYLNATLMLDTGIANSVEW